MSGFLSHQLPTYSNEKYPGCCYGNVYRGLYYLSIFRDYDRPLIRIPIKQLGAWGSNLCSKSYRGSYGWCDFSPRQVYDTPVTWQGSLLPPDVCHVKVCRGVLMCWCFVVAVATSNKVSYIFVLDSCKISGIFQENLMIWGLNVLNLRFLDMFLGIMSHVFPLVSSATITRGKS